jgi:competence protein ComEC
LQTPEYSDTQTIIRSGIWYIAIPGYIEIIPGNRVSFVGQVEPKMLMGQTRQIVMKEPKFEVLEVLPEISIFNKLIITLSEHRERWVRVFQQRLPEPMASLGAGILFGVNGQIPREFYDALVKTGTLHIVAASGYNVSIVAQVLIKMFGSVFTRGLAVEIGVIGILLYVLLAGSSASVVRAGIMGGLTLIAYYFGRPTEAKRLLWMAAGIMLLINPLLLLDIGFQLSVGATGGLLYLAPLMKKFPQHHFLKEYLYPTLAATVATLPIILYHFGRVSWISPMVNMLVLPVVPLIMLLSAITLVFKPVAYLLYVPLWVMVYVIKIFGN